jgi:HAD superfamily hydrolase (TIGR01549 family)
MPRPGLRAVLFDWDGTLLNSAESSFRVYVRLFTSFGLAFDRAHFEQTYSPNWYRTYSAVGLPESRWAEADDTWVRFYAEEETPLMSGALEALTRLREAGLLVGLVTSGGRERVARDLASLDVHAFFRTVVCSEDAARKKPHPEALLLALERLVVAPPEAAYVGDSPEDVEMARAAGVYSVGVPGGFPNRAALEAAAPDLFASDVTTAVGTLLR